MSDMTASAVQELPGFVDTDFARRLEMAEMILPDCVEALRRYGPNDPIAAERIAGGIAFFAGVTYPVNQIVGMGLEGEVTTHDIDRVEDFFRSRGVPSTIVVSPLAHESLRILLGERGYSIAEFNSVLIRRIHSQEPFSPPCGVAIERVAPATLKPWMNAIAKGFEQDIAVAKDVFGGFAALPGALAFLARIEGKVAGGCGGRVIPEARIAGAVRHGNPARVSPARRAERLNRASPAGGGSRRLRVCCGLHPSRQRLATQPGTARFPAGLYQSRDDAKLAGDTEGIERWKLKPSGATV
jgi:hypothetical protein